MDSISRYFNAEKAESLLFILVGVVAICFAAFFVFKLKSQYYNGMAIPFVLIAAIQLTVGITVYMRSPKDIKRVNEIVNTARVKIQSEEIPRMETVMKNFIIYRYVELALMAAGGFLMFVFKEKEFINGLGFGLLIQSGFMLLLDYFAEKRGSEYLTYLMEIVKS